MNKTILIVEDEESLMTALTDRFTKDGFNVIQSKDGQEGLDAAIKKHPDLILLDVIMPVMDGMTMLTKLRQDSWGKGVKVIFLTNLTDASKEAQSMEEGVSEYLIKSDWKLEDIVEKVKKQLSSSKA